MYKAYYRRGGKPKRSGAGKGGGGAATTTTYAQDENVKKMVHNDYAAGRTSNRYLALLDTTTRQRDLICCPLCFIHSC